MKKISFALFLVACMILTIVPVASANPVDSEEQTVQLDLIKVKIPYSPSKVNLVRHENDGEVRVEVLDKETGQLVTAYGEYVEKNNFSTRSTSADGYSIHVVYEDEVIGNIITARLNTRLELYTSGSFRQINSVLATYWEEISSGNWVLQNATGNTISNSGSFPTVSTTTQGNATVVL